MRRQTLHYLLLLAALAISVWIIVAAGSAIYPAAAAPPTIRPSATVNEHAGNPILILLVQIGVILALSRVLGRAGQWVRQPLVIGEMIAGILLGPSLLGWLAPDLSAALFPPQSIENLRILSQVGVIFFLFLIGLELDPKLFRNRGQAAMFISHASMAVPFVFGAGLTLYLYPRFFGDAPGAEFAPVALFMGAAMSVTALPVLARMLTERNLHRTETGGIAITCAALGDATAWCLLAVVIGVARAQGVMQGLITAGLALAYVAAMFLLVRPLLRRLQRLHDLRGGLSQGVLAIIFVLVLASSWITERIGIHALFGAFMVGAIMPKGTLFVRNLVEKLEDFVVVFLLPIFFAYAGLQTQIGLLNEPGLWTDTLLIVAVACIGKFGGTAVAALVSGVPGRDSAVLGVLMNTRGLMELVILQIGLQEGILTPPVFAMMVIMALVTTGMTSPLLSWLIPRQIAAASQPAGPSVLIPVAAPESGPALARLAAALLGGRPDLAVSPTTDTGPTSIAAAERGRILALHLVRPDDDQFGAGLTELDERRDEAIRPLLAAAVNLRVPVEPISFAATNLDDDIVAVADARQAWLLLMGFHRPVFGTEILGGVVHGVLQQAKCHVGVFVDRGLGFPKRLLVPYLGGSHDRAALALAERMARLSGSSVTVLHLVPPDRNPDARRLDAQGAIEKAFTEPTSRASVRLSIAITDSPIDATLREAPSYDLVLVGVDEKWGLESHLFGFRPQRLASECPTSVLIVRRGQNDAKFLPALG